jgi:hypothetical protein
VGVPKTIDNDILLMDKTFGFDTAVEAAQRAINSAYIEVIHFSNLSGSHSYISLSNSIVYSPYLLPLKNIFLVNTMFRHILHFMASDWSS